MVSGGVSQAPVGASALQAGKPQLLVMTMTGVVRCGRVSNVWGICEGANSNRTPKTVRAAMCS
jgi:hypothetical protein